MRIIIMEYNNRIVMTELFICKTKYSIHVILYVSIPKGDIDRVFGHEKNR
jgi:hypothetical protein